MTSQYGITVFIDIPTIVRDEIWNVLFYERFNQLAKDQANTETIIAEGVKYELLKCINSIKFGDQLLDLTNKDGIIMFQDKLIDKLPVLIYTSIAKFANIYREYQNQMFTQDVLVNERTIPVTLDVSIELFTGV